MAEGDGAIYNNFKEQVMEAVFDLLNDAINLILVSGYVPDIDNDTQYADVAGDEYGAGLGYTVGGEVLAGQTVVQDNANDRGVFDANDVLWAALGPLAPNTPSHAILYDDTAAGDELICYWEIGVTATNGGNYTLQFSGVGIMTLT